MVLAVVVLDLRREMEIKTGWGGSSSCKSHYAVTADENL